MFKIRKQFLAACMLVAAAVVPGIAAAWENVGVIDGVKVQRKSEPGSGQFSFRGEVVTDLHIGKVLSVFLDHTQRKHWVDRYKDSKVLAKPAPLTEIYWIQFQLPFPVSNRDYVLQAEGDADPNKRVFTTHIKSVERADKPVDDCCVRAVTRTKYIFEAIPGTEKTRLTVEVNTNPKGSLPDWLVNLIQKKWPSKTLNGLINRAKVVNRVHPDYAGWHAAP
jgi:hypothetical protein